MLRYSTPTIEIETDIELKDANNLWLSFRQGEKILRKTKKDLDIEGTSIKVTLTQEETAMFDADKSVRIQLRWLIADKASGSNIIGVTFKEVLEDEVITNEN